MDYEEYNYYYGLERAALGATKDDVNELSVNNKTLRVARDAYLLGLEDGLILKTLKIEGGLK